MKHCFWVGGYSTQNENGIAKVEYDPKNGFTILENFNGFLNPSFVKEHPLRKILYAVEETAPQGKVHALRFNDGKLIKVNSVSSFGADPCHLSISKDGRFLYAANYTSGSLAAYELNQEGEIIRLSDFVQHSGTGFDPIRQEGPHVHYSAEKDGLLYVCDLGLDQIALYKNKNGKLIKQSAIHLPSGSGPRHIAFTERYPDRTYCTAELNSRVYVIQKKPDESYQMIQEKRTVPEVFSGENTTAAIRFTADGRMLMVSNRGHDSIAIFRVDHDGNISSPVIAACVAQPRDFIILGNDVIVGSQHDSCIHAYCLDEESLRLTDAGWVLPLPHPTSFELSL